MSALSAELTFDLNAANFRFPPILWKNNALLSQKVMR